ncbi:hypothetical protein SFK227_1759 [Shigella flexneri K-227]|uniref:Uncharacterized protein n=1 Tax=Shigella flexneri K-227 TaxID=766147 RepID=F5NUF9_SHIFL|nr:hypothetical protein SFK272_2085 [Shigella flexneri K-272]EGK37981.1 hypothetical protein SFK227_1759 [Shigella flexneri K-227]
MSLVLKHLRQQIMEMGDTMFGNATTASAVIGAIVVLFIYRKIKS